METKELKKLNKVELVDKAMKKMVAGGNCSDACREWQEDCGGEGWDDCGGFHDICNYTDINSR